MEMLDELFERDKPPIDQSDMPGEKTVLDGYEALTALLTYPTWKGLPRVLSSLTIQYSTPLWTARLNDNENRRSSTASGASVADAIESLDRQLVSKDPRWWQWPDYAGGKKNVGKSGTQSKR